MREIAAGLARAFDRIDDFRSVQADASPEQLLDAVLCLQEAVGIERQTRLVLRNRLEQLSGRNQAGLVLLGVIVGLFAAELAGEGVLEET